MQNRQPDGTPLSMMLNPELRIERVTLANGAHCHVVDEVLREPERVVAWAAAHRSDIRPVDFYAYPGTHLPVPPSVDEVLRDFFVRHLRALFDARRLLHLSCRLSMVTLPPSALHPLQWLCHADSFGLEPTQSIQASVLYLFRDEALGGTSFYEPTRSADMTRQVFADSTRLRPDVFSGRYGIQPGYMHGSNDYFRLVGTIPARWNRMIVYDGSMLHSGHITAPERLTTDPTTGRLTFNGFFTCRRQSR